MQIADLLSAQNIASKAQASSKKRVLEQLSGLLVASHPQVSPAQAFESLLARERLGGTGLGKGVAIPHGRIKSRETAIGAFIQLADGIDFDAVDSQPVDLLFALLVPENSTDEHLRILAHLARMFDDPDLRRALREATTPEGLYELLTTWRPKN
jgi:PTS system nitrogen regulatory IIA component